jgi:hypothetical protein
VITYYGASCGGPRGYWFMNMVEGGSNTALIPNYRLHWNFAGSSTARPDGSISVTSGGSSSATMTLSEGVIRVKGTRANGSKVEASGTVVVEVSGPANAPRLTFTENGLAAAEQSLGLVSPFLQESRPYSVPITIQAQFRNC